VKDTLEEQVRTGLAVIPVQGVARSWKGEATGKRGGKRRIYWRQRKREIETSFATDGSPIAAGIEVVGRGENRV